MIVNLFYKLQEKKLHKKFDKILKDFNTDLKGVKKKNFDKDTLLIYNALQDLSKNLDKRILCQTNGLFAKYMLGKLEGIKICVYLFDKIYKEKK
tara:strand:- start:10101 stop:10382 length:282 start_codon:yes stop_codon:yes gene_type:complete